VSTTGCGVRDAFTGWAVAGRYTYIATPTVLLIHLTIAHYAPCVLYALHSLNALSALNALNALTTPSSLTTLNHSTMPSLPHPTTSNPLLIDFSTVEPSTPILRIPLVLQVSPLLKVTSLRDQLNTHGGIPLPLSPSTLSEIQALNRRIRASDAGAWAKLASERLVDEAMDAYFGKSNL